MTQVLAALDAEDRVSGKLKSSRGPRRGPTIWIGAELGRGPAGGRARQVADQPACSPRSQDRPEAGVISRLDSILCPSAPGRVTSLLPSAPPRSRRSAA